MYSVISIKGEEVQYQDLFFPVFCLRAANLYFLFIVMLNWIPVVEAFQKEITMIPLVVVLIVIAFKDALEDYRRYRFDKMVNNNIVSVYSG